MKNNNQIEKEAGRIADEIVRLVERTNGPVTLVQVRREIPGFAALEPPFWSHTITHASGEISYWGEMTEAGGKALRKVTKERRVAVQFVNDVPYRFDGCVSTDENWQPVVLLPAEAANMQTPNGLMRFPEWFLKRYMELPDIGDNRPLVSHYAGATADEFFDLNAGDQLFLFTKGAPTALDMIAWSKVASRGNVQSWNF